MLSTFTKLDSEPGTGLGTEALKSLSVKQQSQYKVINVLDRVSARCQEGYGAGSVTSCWGGSEETS